MRPDVSLVMPAWNVPRPWLLEAVESALDETACAVELIVVDDESPEPVAEALAHVGDPRLRVVRTAHRGPYGARDAGLGLAQGRVVRFLDADDVVVAGSTARLLRLLDDRDDVVAHGLTVVCDETLRPLRTIGSTLDGDAVAACLLGRFEVRVVAMAFPRRVVDAAGPWDVGFRVSGDWDWVLRALEHAEVRPDPEPAALYRRHASSVTLTADVAAGETARHRVIDGYLARHPEERGRSLEHRARAAAHLDRAAAYARSGDTGRALHRLWSALRLRPVASLGQVPHVVRARVRPARGADRRAS